MIRSLQNLLWRKHAARLGRDAIGWLGDHASSFKISRARGATVPWQVKPLVELMFLLTALKRHGVRNPSLDRLSATAAAEGGDFDWHELAAYDPSAATGMALVADFYHSLGRPAPFDEGFFGFLNRIEYFEGMDRLPYRDMDLAYNLGRLVAPDYEDAIPVWFRSTAFGRRQHPIRYTIDDLYSLTHAIFYITDLGLRSAQSMLDSATSTRLLGELPNLTAGMLRADNVDVLGELVLCWLFCGVPNSAVNRVIFDSAFNQVMSAATKDGAVAPTAHISGLARAGQATFQQLYHTTLVGAFLFTLLAETDSYDLN
jgi:uncharacterized protein DUF6895